MLLFLVLGGALLGHEFVRVLELVLEDGWGWLFVDCVCIFPDAYLLVVLSKGCKVEDWYYTTFLCFLRVVVLVARVARLHLEDLLILIDWILLRVEYL